MKRIQSKKPKLGTYETDKISLSCFDVKDKCQMMKFMRQLIFIRIVLQDVKRLKKIVIKKTVKKLKKIVIKKRLKKIVIKKTVKRPHVSKKMNSVVM